ncbi:hypothetical protein SGFS_047790 [Streptomyces graminofaciens]|uniref:NlpC/P60 domain-containing protein n=1 Tax=Streptomyces graminofaciens TaxID=68212 RepID=A0ABN5VLH3_9ACTN|nr:peptidoglycan-binding protein [Streptomyces graminofaciens]BBC33485.1 hypothetical protein SGFS_047790 [Streptomyces graminofaciens]
METPAFEEFAPESDCDCPGCAHWRRVTPYSSRHLHPGPFGHPAGRVALAAVTAAGAALAVGHAVPAVAATHGPARPGPVPADDGPGTPQGGKAPLHGPAGRSTEGEKLSPATKTPPITRAEIIRRARTWIAAEVPYSMTSYWWDGYRQDCSGFVSMAWNLPGNEWTGSLGNFAERISKEWLQPGDILLFHNPDDPQKGSHVVIFGGWTDYTHTGYIAYEATPPYARRQATPYAYWNNSSRYEAYRYKGLVGEGAGAPDGDGTGTPASWDGTAGSSGSEGPQGARYPGAAYFGPGANNRYVTLLGQLLVERGGARFYANGPGPRWSDADRRATHAFQRAQGWSGRDADGYPGPLTWTYLVTGKGRDIAPPAGYPGPPGMADRLAAPPGPQEVPAYPGRAMFRPGADNAHVVRLGQQLLKKGFGKHYTSGPGSRWGEEDRRNVEAFQRAQGWRGNAADGSPGPETWRRLFS